MYSMHACVGFTTESDFPPVSTSRSPLIIMLILDPRSILLGWSMYVQCTYTCGCTMYIHVHMHMYMSLACSVCVCVCVCVCMFWQAYTWHVYLPQGSACPWVSPNHSQAQVYKLVHINLAINLVIDTESTHTVGLCWAYCRDTEDLGQFSSAFCCGVESEATATTPWD